MDVSIVATITQALEAAMHNDPFGMLVVYPTAIVTVAFMIWASLQQEFVSQSA